MAQPDTSHYTVLDRPEISDVIFYPRAEDARASASRRGEDHLITVAPDVQVGARFHMVAVDAPNLLFFHGNGEIVADYDELSSFYNKMGINFLPVDYRGYGRSGGRPTVGSMMADSHIILDYVRNRLAAGGFKGPLAIMGRSLGSACALELAAAHPENINGLVIESGFAYAGPLLRLLGVAVDRIGFKEEEGFGNLAKIRRFKGPTLIIHAQHDHIIPFADGQALFDASPAPEKKMLRIDGADHNDLFYVGLEKYLTAIREFVDSLNR
jgi:alpha-beta hydrolase superfamily lysophospholipase